MKVRNLQSRSHVLTYLLSNNSCFVIKRAQIIPFLHILNNEWFFGHILPYICSIHEHILQNISYTACFHAEGHINAIDYPKCVLSHMHILENIFIYRLFSCTISVLMCRWEFRGEKSMSKLFEHFDISVQIFQILHF